MRQNMPLFALLCLFHFAFGMTRAETVYRLRWGQPQEFTFYVEIELEPQAGTHTELQLPVWRPGRYIIQDYAAAVSRFEASDANGMPLSWKKSEKSVWRITNPTQGRLTVRYAFYAKTLDAGSSYVDQNLVYFNGINLFMYVKERINEPCRLLIPDIPAEWKVASALQPTGKTHEYRTASYHELADCPTMISPDLTSFRFDHAGLTVHLHFYQYAAPKGAEVTLIENVRKITREQHALFGSWPFEAKEYHHLYLLLPFNLRHAVEHTTSAMYTLPQSVATSATSFGGLYGITSHEFWHIWNVKTIRPAALYPYDYSREQYTGLHWFTEGVTDYYTNLTLVRAGILTLQQYLDELSKTLNLLHTLPQSKRVSPVEGSWDSWLDPSAYKDPNQRLSFYMTGSRIGFFLDLEIRRLTDGKFSLDDVFRYLFREYAQRNKGYPENGIELAIRDLTGQDLSGFFDAYIYGVQPIPYDRFLAPFGLEAAFDTTFSGDCLSRLGLSRYELVEKGLYVENLRTDSELWLAGLSKDDLILEINGQPAADALRSLICQPNQRIKIKYRRLFSDYELLVSPDPGNAPSKLTLRVTDQKNRLLNHWLQSNYKGGY
jgi:predicted metalloprotease with PDZ domain